jgi:hypothetical protein
MRTRCAKTKDDVGSQGEPGCPQPGRAPINRPTRPRRPNRRRRYTPLHTFTHREKTRSSKTRRPRHRQLLLFKHYSMHSPVTHRSPPPPDPVSDLQRITPRVHAIRLSKTKEKLDSISGSITITNREIGAL